jgi:hypothetical protein
MILSKIYAPLGATAFCILQLDRAALGAKFPKMERAMFFGNLISVYLVSSKKKLIGSPTAEPLGYLISPIGYICPIGNVFC